MRFPFKYFISLMVTTLVLVAMLGFMFEYAGEWSGPHYPVIIVSVLFFGTLFSHIIARFATEIKGGSFVHIVMLSMVLRILFYGILALVIILIEKEVIADMVLFGVVYLVYTVHDVVIMAMKKTN